MTPYLHMLFVLPTPNIANSIDIIMGQRDVANATLPFFLGSKLIVILSYKPVKVREIY